jgi:outer membrane protein assembly factor BamC
MMNFRKLTWLLMTATVLVTGACGSFNVEEYLPDKKVEYKKSEAAGKDLELPPDLTHARAGSDFYVPPASTGAGVATYSEFLGQKNIATQGRAINTNILPSVENVELKRDGQERWLIINSSPQIVWPNVVSFWQENGILLIEQDPTVGVMRTGWLENRADISSDFITDTLRGFFDSIYSAATRDQYRVRLEEGDEPGTTELYLTHFGMEEKIETSTTNEGDRSIWVPRGTDPGLEAEMLRRLMVHLGVKEKRAETLLATKVREKAKRSELIKNKNESKLMIDESFAKAWRLTGLALDRVGFAVEDRDRSKGIYYVRYNDPMADVETDEGWLSKLNFWSSSNKQEQDDRYQIQVSSTGDAVAVIVLDEQGSKQISDTATRILTLIHEQIN